MLSLAGTRTGRLMYGTKPFQLTVLILKNAKETDNKF